MTPSKFKSFVANKTKVTPSMLKFSWSITRFKSLDLERMFGDPEMGTEYIGLIMKPGRATKKEQARLKELGNALRTKYTRPWYTYVLVRTSQEQNDIVKKLAALPKDERKAFSKTSNYKDLQAICSAEAEKSRHFSSLSNMQKYVNKNDITDENGNVLDVYALWESMKKEENNNGK